MRHNISLCWTLCVVLRRFLVWFVDIKHSMSGIARHNSFAGD